MGLRVQVKQLPGKCVRAYVRSNKTDATNAAALLKYPDCFEVCQRQWRDSLEQELDQCFHRLCR